MRAYLGLPYVAGLAVYRNLAREEVLRRLPLEYGSDADLVVGVGLQDLPRLRRTGMVSELGEQHTLHRRPHHAFCMPILSAMAHGVPWSQGLVCVSYPCEIPCVGASAAAFR